MRRQKQLEQLNPNKIFDLLIIGGGATGCGVALDAASRGLKVALVEMNDFAEGTSSRSTKLVHGGVRYLEAAIKKFDRVQYNLVKDGLHERYTLLKNAPHLSNRLPLVTPIYRWIDVPYVYAGLKLYDLLAGKRGIGHSRLLSRKAALQRFPTVKAAGLKAGVLYYDGQFHDARMALSLALTAREQGATIANHVRVCELVKNNGQVCGARLEDRITGESWQIAARGIINATGPFADQIRRLDSANAAPILSASSGIHIVLDKSFAPPDTGLLIPETDDGRVLFVLPWEGHALVGTTDEPAEISEHPKAQEAEIDYLLKHIGRYFNLQVSRQDIQAVWSGLRPLVRDPAASDTAQLARDHVIEISASGLLTIAGGKWTTYRKMAEDTVNEALKQFGLSPPHKTCQTEQLPLIGGKDYRETIQPELQKNFAFSAEIAAYLQRTYGDQAFEVAKLATADGGKLLCQGHPILEAEVVYAVRHEMAERVIDLLARRTPLALVDQAASRAVIGRVAELMAKELEWDEKRIEIEMALAEERLNEAI
ncbi:MAG: FAD-dependent oxidoreductase [Deltaproteobacteria bacterium]|nr:FAD-dependent oxidoreductase [Deltaproteobacteria bacterium]NCP03755.1 FAD-dependent oxidoreductase [Deltaproteobacteria bacterium]